MNSARSERRPFFPLLTLAIAAVTLGAAPEAAAEWLQFDRAALAGGQAWRAWTGHLTHFDPSHLGWDLAAFVVLGAAVERRARAPLGFTLLVAAPVISIAVAVFAPHLELYRGLSGLDSTLLALLATFLVRSGSRAGRGLGITALVTLLGKCVLETQRATPLFAASGVYEVVPVAHAAGLIAGIVLGVVTRAPDPVSREGSEGSEGRRLNSTSSPLAEPTRHGQMAR